MVSHLVAKNPNCISVKNGETWLQVAERETLEGTNKTRVQEVIGVPLMKCKHRIVTTTFSCWQDFRNEESHLIAGVNRLDSLKDNGYS